MAPQYGSSGQHSEANTPPSQIPDDGDVIFVNFSAGSRPVFFEDTDQPFGIPSFSWDPLSHLTIEIPLCACVLTALATKGSRAFLADFDIVVEVAGVPIEADALRVEIDSDREVMIVFAYGQHFTDVPADELRREPTWIDPRRRVCVLMDGIEIARILVQRIDVPPSTGSAICCFGNDAA